ncbi:Phosphoinositide phosphatase sac1 [Chytriomyces hyalinus]|nr:Phosphoinositide phosphatase sac1 [Chytriomyces hyalinus]
MSTVRVHDTLSLYQSSDSFTLEPVYANAAVQRHSLVFGRTSTPSLAPIRIDTPPAPTLAQEERDSVYGIIGIVTLNAGDHLILVTNRQKVAKILGNDIYKLTAHKIVPISKNGSLSLTAIQQRDDHVYLGMLDSLLGNGFWYFSYQADITRNIQRLADPTLVKQSLWEQADERFFWNKNLQTPLINLSKSHPETDIGAFILPLVCGFMEFKHLSYNSKRVSLGIISRRSKFRAGTRYNTRGVDVDGNVANNVETEQILMTTSDDGVEKVASYVQTRGSIPLFWEQQINVKYQPKMVIHDGAASFQSFKKHFNNQIAQYGPQIAVNLINKKGYEARLSETWSNLNAQLNDPQVRYLHFDFHHECKGNRWDRIEKLVAEIEADLIVQGYCVANGVVAAPGSGDVSVHSLRKQSSVVRTNCMDCLDRTNVVQSMLARRVIPMQLQEILGGTGVVEPEFEQAFKNLWADHADAISLVYTGTGALKTDFTRTGKRSPAGVLNDLNNSIVRYVKNNFFDGERQDSFDLFLGNYHVNALATSPFELENRPTRYIVLPALMTLGVFMFLITLIMFHYSAFYYVLALLFWLSVVVASQRAIVYYGTDFVDKPRLVRPQVLSPELKISEKPTSIFSPTEEDVKKK